MKDNLLVSFKDIKGRILFYISGLSVSLILLFIIYGEINSHSIFIIMYGIALLVIFEINKYMKKKDKTVSRNGRAKV